MNGMTDEEDELNELQDKCFGEVIAGGIS